MDTSVKADSIVNRLETPGLFSGSKATIPSESVTELLIFFSISFGLSKSRIVAFRLDLIYSFSSVGLVSDLIRAPFLGSEFQELSILHHSVC